MLQKEKQALREKVDLLQEESQSMQKTIGVEGSAGYSLQRYEAFLAALEQVARP